MFSSWYWLAYFVGTGGGFKWEKNWDFYGSDITTVLPEKDEYVEARKNRILNSPVSRGTVYWSSLKLNTLQSILVLISVGGFPIMIFSLNLLEIWLGPIKPYISTIIHFNKRYNCVYSDIQWDQNLKSIFTPTDSCGYSCATSLNWLCIRISTSIQGNFIWRNLIL